jgi:hypothetical protein
MRSESVVFLLLSVLGVGVPGSLVCVITRASSMLVLGRGMWAVGWGFGWGSIFTWVVCWQGCALTEGDVFGLVLAKRHGLMQEGFWCLVFFWGGLAGFLVGEWVGLWVCLVRFTLLWGFRLH